MRSWVMEAFYIFSPEPDLCGFLTDNIATELKKLQLVSEIIVKMPQPQIRF